MGIFGFGKTKMAGAGPYVGGNMGRAESQMHEGYVKGYGMGEARRPRGTSRLPGEMTSARQYADGPISQRATTSGGNEALMQRVVANKRVNANVAASANVRQARAAAAARAEFGGGMGMGIPTNAPSGGPRIPMLAGSTAQEQNVMSSRAGRGGGFRCLKYGWQNY